MTTITIERELLERVSALLDEYDAEEFDSATVSDVRAALAAPATAPEQPAWQDAPTEVKQIAEALRQIGLTLVRTGDGYKVLKLGAITAQEDKP